MHKKLILAAVLGLVLPLLFSCKKYEGRGGTSTIKGVLKAVKKNANGDITSTYAAAKEDLFIIYGESSSYFDDKIESSYDGSFEFRLLEKGTYSVFYYEKCTTCAGNKKAIVVQTSISKKKEVVDLGTLEMID